LVVAGLYAQFSVKLFGDFLRTHNLTTLLLLVSELLVVVFTIFRRRAQIVDRSWPTRIVTTLALILAVGAAVVIAAKMTLGRSFGIAPANRGVVATGPYSVVRHPIYAGYLVTHMAFLIAHPTLWNTVILIVSDLCLVARSSFEERILSNDAQYRQYCQRVGWRLLPGVY
jgi:protein-S-isoprenylcysteine O-methyltransferase Ste14